MDRYISSTSSTPYRGGVNGGFVAKNVFPDSRLPRGILGGIRLMDAASRAVQSTHRNIPFVYVGHSMNHHTSHFRTIVMLRMVEYICQPLVDVYGAFRGSEGRSQHKWRVTPAVLRVSCSFCAVMRGLLSSWVRR